MILTVDLEDHTGAYTADGRYVPLTHRVLDALDALGVRGTFFVVGRVAEAVPGLLRRVVARGDEIACHGYDHTALDRYGTVAAFRDATRRAKAALEDASGVAVRGYRAPIFSLTRRTRWAIPVLAELGFTYSSSVLPVASPLYGYPGAPRTPFRWESELLEFPVPVASVAGLEVPYLGGVYLRYLPRRVVAAHVARTRPNVLLWTNLHPYDFDAGGPFTRWDGHRLFTSLILSLNRRRTFDKLRWLVATFGIAGERLIDHAPRAWAARLPRFVPEAVDI